MNATGKRVLLCLLSHASQAWGFGDTHRLINLEIYRGAAFGSGPLSPVSNLWDPHVAAGDNPRLGVSERPAAGRRPVRGRHQAG